MTTESDSPQTDAEEQATAPAASGGLGRGGKARGQAEQPPEQPKDEQAGEDENEAPEFDPPGEPPETPEPSFTLARILDPVEGPAISGHPWSTIVGALKDDYERAKHDVEAGEEELTQAEVVKRIEEWLGREVEHDNRVGPVDQPDEPEGEG